MVDIKTLLPELQEVVGELAEDLRSRAEENAEIDAGLREAFKQITKGGRTAQAYEIWREDYLDQVAVAWVLACVFVRFMEDNHLIDECWLAGEKDRRNLAEDSHELFFRKHPHDTDREYFQHVFHEVGKIPAAKDLFAEGKTPLWAVAPSGDAAMKLLTFWREMAPETGQLKRSFEVQSGDTRFLGDLYQDLSERARKKYALLQTPVFVEEFILDRTLNPATDEFSLDKVRMIDPTCGSGHFLLGGFARLFDLWIKRENNEVVAAQKALDGVWGVDINPFAVAIARFRLIVAALQACGIKRLKQAPAWKIHLATGDSLLFGSRWTRTGDKVLEQAWLVSNEESWAPEIYACEDKDAIQEVLCQQYHAVVGNPPYIIVRDRTLNAAYRVRYSTCHQKYSLAVPFAERFFDLCLTNGNGKSGYVGMITSNSFMKREFGKKLIEVFFPKIDLTHVVDTSGAYIPGHGTPTVILFGRNRKPTGDAVRAVMGIKGEPGTPDDASNGFVWQSIVKQIDRANAQDDFVSTADVPRTMFNNHPWSIGGGGAAELKETLHEAAPQTVGDFAASVGITAVTGEDEVYVFPRKHDVERLGIHDLCWFVQGDMIRDHVMSSPVVALWPYDKHFRLCDEKQLPALIRVLWTCKTSISHRRRFGTPMLLKGAKWYEWQELYDDKFLTPLAIAFSEVATHNHFVLDRGGKVFKNSAPIIKLSEGATEDNHLELLGPLNSSTACFWLKQVCHNKGSTVDQHGARQRTDPFEDFYAFNSTRISEFPLPAEKPVALARQLDKLGRSYFALLPEAMIQSAAPTAVRLDEARTKAAAIRGQMIALQEELDWQCYQLYGLLSDDLGYKGGDLPEIAFGQRAFEIVMARQLDKGELDTTWFKRHGSKPNAEIPNQWPSAYRKVVEQRIEIIETIKELALIEKPEYKRRWNTEPWQEREQRALRTWLLDRLESTRYWPDVMKNEPTLQTTAQLADKASGDHDFTQVATQYRGRPDFDVTALIADLVSSEAVPFLPIIRYKLSGLRKRAVWEQTWELQREDDRFAQKVEELRQQLKSQQEEYANKPPADVERMLGLIRRDIQQRETEWREFSQSIPVPPKYATADFQKTDFWRLRGKLDVPNERWISYPHCSTDSDQSLLIGWAGWNHLQQATALVHFYDSRKREGWDAKRLTPLLAGLDQLLPWIHQWHPEIDPEFGESAGQSFQTMLEHDAHELGLTLEDVRNWQPPQTTARRQRARN